MANALANESSPYLLQHKDNPVDWLPWGEIALEKARSQNKPMIISIGYSACHWCHVMEHESFEDETVAQWMNANFVCIKVDREERPDIDQVYMDAVQLMTGQGGWPLNCFALPDGRPFFGGTYFPKTRWIETLQNVIRAFDQDHDRLIDYATKLTEGLQEMDALPVRKAPELFSDESVEAAIGRWTKRFDNMNGGAAGAPKFPLPNNYDLLLHYATSEGDREIEQHVRLTLNKMAWGGLYDQIGGGFTRYSTDEIWKVPHFEKMLYDNGQLLSLYAQAFLRFNDPEYKRIVEETAQFILRELRSPAGLFYSALDADSEGEEGKFYVWTKEAFASIVPDEAELFSTIYGLDGPGHWEEGNYIPMQQGSIRSFAERADLSAEKLTKKVSRFKEAALNLREERQRPGLDNKRIVSWNGMTIRGLCDAYVSTQNPSLLLAAKSAMQALVTIWDEHNYLPHTIQDGQVQPGFLEDYAHLAWAAIRMYEVSFEQPHLSFAHALGTYVLNNFDQNESGFFYFQAKQSEQLVAKKVEINDNVIPASNSIMASVLFTLSRIYGDLEMKRIVEQQIATVEPQFSHYPAGYSQWMKLLLWHAEPFYEIAILGPHCEQKRDTLLQNYLPNVVICGSTDEQDLPIFQGRFKEGETRIFVCKDGTCELPVHAVEEALQRIQ